MLPNFILDFALKHPQWFLGYFQRRLDKAIRLQLAGRLDKKGEAEMWNSVISMTVLLAVTILKSVTKNPKVASAEGHVIAQIAEAATEADQAVNGTVWSSTPGTAPAA